MMSLEEFQTELCATMQRLGPSPSLAEVEKAGRLLVADGIPDGANLEGMLLLRELAEMAEQEQKQHEHSG